MENPVAKSRGRPRKRRREEEENQGGGKEGDDNYNSDGENNEGNVGGEDLQNGVSHRKRGRPPKRRAVEIKGVTMVGRYVLKEFEGSGVFLGKVVKYDSGLYRVDYEDGDCEDLDSGELREFLIGDERQKFGSGDLLDRKKKLDEKIDRKRGVVVSKEVNKGVKLSVEAKKGMKLDDEPKKGVTVELVFALERVDLAKSVKQEQVAGIAEDDVSSELPNENGDIEIDDNDVDYAEGDDEDDDDYVGDDDDNVEDDDDDDGDEEDSSSDFREYGQGWETRAETEIPVAPPPELPPSSGTIGVPEDYVSHFFSVYGFLRTFSVRLFLSPFTLDDLVGCLKCTVPNTLLDAIHVALLRALRQHLEGLASEGSQLASKCLRSIDWGLLDVLTWPVFLVHYMIIMEHLNGKEWNGLYINILGKNYCTLSVGTKLTILQILCDDALDTRAIREEIDTREESEVGVDSDGVSLNSFENGPRKVFPRSFKTSVGKDRVAVNSEADNSVLLSSMTVKSDDQSRGTDDVDEDGNGDECRLCGMEGMLVCCDGCPSAYHTRCIGVNKLSIPDGKWFCPECTISRLCPPITIGTLLRGAEVFGVDPYAQLFLGTCNHLLVLKLSVKASSFVRYYNWNDIPKVISALSASPYHAVPYLGICQGISKYWELPPVLSPPLVISQTTMSLVNVGGNKQLPFQSYPSVTDGNQTVPSSIGHGIIGTDVNISGTQKLSLNCGVNDISSGVLMQTDPRSMPCLGIAPMEQNSIDMTTKLSDQSELSQIAQPGQVDSLTTTGLASWNSRFSSCAGEKNGVSLPETPVLQVKGDSNKVGGKAAQKKDTCLYMGSIFKPLAYINNYVHGDFAASAASNFAGLSSDENRPSEIHASDPRKAMAANVSLQVKAFSSAAVRFFWPSTEKKLFEIPRERCSWCLHCRAPIASRKACLLNQAALNATRAEMKFISSLRLVKNVDGGLYGIAAYTLYLEESLRGLIIGPYRHSGYREQWRKQVEEAATCSEMKALLLDLERNLCAIAISSEWTKLVDYWMDDSPVPQNAAVAGSTQKRSTGRRKKHIATPEVTADDSNDSKDTIWWRGGNLAKLVFQRGTFPGSVVRKTARQGGSRRLPGIYYADGLDVPKRSRQFIWRAAVEMAKNTSQLALQVRYFDQYIKWSDLVRPEQNSGDGKGPETEALAFRNAQICDKKVVENKITYGVAFGHQKHLSTRLMKSVIAKEESQDGKEKYWFQEARIPLYLIKEYEENVEITDPPPIVKPDHYTKHQKRQLRAARKEVFVYLGHKLDNLFLCRCASCNEGVLVKAAVNCGSCEGFCHQNCMVSSTVSSNEDVEYRTTCKKCLYGRSVLHTNSMVESPTSPLAIQGTEFQNSAGVANSGRFKPSSQLYQNSASGAKSQRRKDGIQPERRSGKKPAPSDSNSTKSKKRSSLHWGLIWKKKPTDDRSDFRNRNILFRGSSDGSSLSPDCHLCHKPYSPHLMYIRCDSCEKWFHADAIGLDESKVSSVMGFKCCRCRRIRSPLCPYADPIENKVEVKRLRIKGPKEEKVDGASASEAISEQADSLPSTPMSLMEMEEDVLIEVDDPLLMSVSQVEQMPEPKLEVDFEWDAPSVPGVQKLPVRRHFKSEKDDDGLTWSDISAVQSNPSAERENRSNPNVDWGVVNGGLGDGTTSTCEPFNFENVDYEPQTYFSYTELLDTDDGNHMEGVGAARDTWESAPLEYPQNGFMEQCKLESFDDPTAFTEPAFDACCEVCLIAAPAPDLTCGICKIQIHSQCSPWEDEILEGDAWVCGQCRGWS